VAEIEAFLEEQGITVGVSPRRLRNAFVEVSGIAHAGSSIQIGVGQRTLDADRRGAVFRLVRAGDDIEIADLPV
jgi:hypothetical protein